MTVPKGMKNINWYCGLMKLQKKEKEIVPKIPKFTFWYFWMKIICALINVMAFVLDGNDKDVIAGRDKI